MLNPWLLYIACVVGAIGVYLMTPRRGRRLALLGGLIAAGALGAAFLGLARLMLDDAGRPGVFFYVFAFLAAGAAARMITHPRPVFAAVYFILVVIASAGLLILLAAEFMAFALVIVYAGAIMVTYLFVIMLAQETPDDQHPDDYAEYDANAREPLAATAVSFVLLAALLGVMNAGVTRIAPALPFGDPDLAQLTGKIKRELIAADLANENSAIVGVDPIGREVLVVEPGGSADAPRIVVLPDDFRIENVERVGLSLVGDFPISLEVAGVILMMAMLGAVTLARKPSRLEAAAAKPGRSEAR
ncbi:MAG: NADH-quinone oxidoreductase subunit J [Phycisphaerales bacterium]